MESHQSRNEEARRDAPPSAGCIEAYVGAFEWEAADAHLQASKIRITVREEQDGKWQRRAKVEISIVPSLPRLPIERGGEPLLIEVGLPPGEKLVLP